MKSPYKIILYAKEIEKTYFIGNKQKVIKQDSRYKISKDK